MTTDPRLDALLAAFGKKECVLNNPPTFADHTTPWEPLTVEQVQTLFSPYDNPWWIGGGWAIDLYLKCETRRHEDIDVIVLRDHLDSVRKVLRGWDLYAADPPGSLRLWPESEALRPPIHDVWCRRGADEPWAMQLMVIDTIDGKWAYRRDRSIRLPLADIGLVDSQGVPFLRPEIQLLFKSKSLREKDQIDFDNVLPQLDGDAKQWLVRAMTVVDPEHRWLALLVGAGAELGE